MNSSKCLIAASEGEGFGLPLIEASRAGIDVIARDLPVFREVADDDTVFFGGSNSPSLKEALLLYHQSSESMNTKRSPQNKVRTWAQSVDDLKQVIFNNGWYN